MQCERSLNVSCNAKTQSSMMVFLWQLVNGGEASSGSPLCCLKAAIQHWLKSHLPLHCCSSSRQRFSRSHMSHLPGPCRCPGCLKAFWMALDTHMWAAEPAHGGQPAEQSWPWASERIQLREHRFLILLYKTLKVLCHSHWPHQEATAPWVS